MKLNIYSIFDKQSNQYGKPFVAINDTLARRAFDSVKQNPDSDLAKYPQDYKLCRLGDLESDTGHITSAVESLPDQG